MLHVMSASDYHAERDLPLSLSQSMAHTLVSLSPAHAWLRHPKLGGKGRKATAAMENGTVIHDLLLNGGKLENIAVLEYDDYRTKAAQEEKKLAIEAGEIPMLLKVFDELSMAAQVLIPKLRDAGIEFKGQTEGVALWEEKDDDGRPVQCKARLDHWLLPQIDDLKTARSAHPDDCVKAIFEWGYDIQAAAYISAMTKLHPEIFEYRMDMHSAENIEAPRFRFHFVELVEPYLFTTIEPDDSILAVGRSKWRRAICLWSKCLRENKWPGYFDGPYSASAPPWKLRDEVAYSADAAELMRYLETEIRA